MNNEKKYLILNLPDTKKYVIHRDWAGTYGTAEIKTNNLRKRVLPIWILYLASALKKNKISFKIIDSQTEEFDNEKTISAAINYNPDFIISMPCLPSYNNDLKILDEIKKINPKIKILVLGGIVNTFSEKILNESRIDYILIGRYPFYNNIIEFLKNYEKGKGIVYKKNNKIIRNQKIEQKNDLDNILLDTYDLIDLKKYLMKSKDKKENTVEWIPILTGVGCPYACTYCAYPICYGKKFYYKKIDRIIDEISYLADKHKINGFLMRDVVFTKDKKRVIELCNKITKNNLKIKFLFETRVDLIDEDIVQHLKKAGCYQINFGVESGNSQILKNVGKPGVNIELLKKSFNLTKKAGILNMAHIIFGLPGENKKTIKDTYKLLKQIKADEVNFNYITPYPGTKLFEQAIIDNLIIEHNWSNYTSHNLVMQSKELSSNELSKEGRKIERKYAIYKLLRDHRFRKRWINNFLKVKFSKLRKPTKISIKFIF